MTDYSDVVSSYVTAAKARAVSSLDDGSPSPEEAARITSLSESSGTPAAVIAGDPDGFEKNYKQSMASSIVSSDAQLMAYVHSHPMAAAVSQDDWGNLAQLSQAMQTHASALKSLASPARPDERPIGEPLATSPFSLMQLVPMSRYPSGWHFDPNAGLLGSLKSFLTTPGDVATGQLKPGTPEWEERSINAAMWIAGGMPDQFPKGGRPWLEAGRSPPTGISPEIDAGKAQANATLNDQLDSALKLAQQSKTKELAPEVFSNLPEQSYGHSSIGISADAAIGLYGDKLPEPDDGLLGWVPHISDKLALARATGADVEVPIADLIAKGDPAVIKALRPGIRAWSGGVTELEAKELEGAVPKQMVDDTIAQVRGASGLEPTFGPGDRKLALVRNDGDGGTQVVDTEGTMHGYDLVDEHGKVVGGAVITPQGKNLEVENISGVAGIWSNSLGPAVIKDLLRQLQAIYPEAETVSGYRVTGARPEPKQIIVKLSGTPAEVKKVIGDPPPTATEVQVPTTVPAIMQNLKASGIGLDVGTMSNLDRQVYERYQRDLARAEARAEREQNRRQAKEWRDNRKEMRKEVEGDIRDQPVVGADLLLGAGELGGKETGRSRYSLRAGDLTPEQIESLPPRYVSGSGFPVEDVARHFGFPSSDTFVEHLAAYNMAKQGRNPHEMFGRLVDVETDRRMEQKYGDLPANILLEAKDQALGEAELNLVNDEYVAAAQMAGVQAVDKGVIKAWTKDAVGKLPLGEMSSDKMLALVRRGQEIAIRAEINGDPVTAAKALQDRSYATHAAAEMVRYEKMEAAFDKLTRAIGKMGAGKDPTKIPIDPEYLNYLHQIMIAVGKPVRRSVQAIGEDVKDRGTGTLEEFAEAKAGMLRVLPVWEKLLDPSFRQNYKTLSGAEFEALTDTIKSLNHNGREELKITKAGEKADLEDKRDDLIASLRRFPKLEYDVEGRRTGVARYTRLPRVFLAESIQAENLLNYWDKFDQWGDWNQWVSRDLIEGNYYEEGLNREYSRKLAGMVDKADLSKTIDNQLFRVPFEEGGFGSPFTMTRENLRAVMLNVGNSAGPKSNLWKLAGGYKDEFDKPLKPEDVMAMVHSVAKKEDWDWVQKIWDEIFTDLKSKGDTMYRSLSGGVAPDSIRIDPIQTPFGEYRGGYYPLDPHPVFHDRVAKDLASGKSSLMDKNFTSALPQNSWTKERTGATYPLRLDLGGMASLMKAQIHDIAMRPGVINASKILYNRRIQNEIKLRYGDEYADMLKAYLKAVANNSDYLTRNQAYANSFLEAGRQNLITTLTGANTGTFMKHTPTALITSIAEVGPEYFSRAVRSMFSISEETGESNFKLINKESLGLQGRKRNWQETLYGQIADQRPGYKHQSLRQTIQEYASLPVALGDLLSADPTYLAAKMKALDEGRSYGDAVYAGERAVRRAHGSTLITNKSAIMRDYNPWFTSIYNFWSTMFNRTMETLWKAGVAIGAAKDGDWEGAQKLLPGIAAGLFAYSIWPAVVEQLTSPSKSNPQDSKGKKLLKAAVYTESSLLPFVRDLGHFLVEGGDFTVGLSQSGYKEGANIWNDLTSKQPMTPAKAQRLIHDAAGFAGLVTGYVTQPVGNVASFGYGVKHRIEHPQGLWGWLTGARYGTLKGHSSTMSNWWQGRGY